MGNKLYRKYSVYGPFDVHTNGKIITKQCVADFWDDVEKKKEDLSRACGCYLFAMKHGDKITPWYVGKTDKRNFCKQSLADRNICLYNEVLQKNGTPTLFLIARMTPKSKFCKPSKKGYKDVRHLETLLIGAALDKNPKLLNIQKTSWLKEIVVPGFLNTPPGKPNASEKALKTALDT